MNNRILLAMVFAVLMAFPVIIASFGNDFVKEAPASEVISLYHTSSPECTDKV